MRFRYIVALYDLTPDQSHIAVPETAEKMLMKMKCDLVGSDDLVAIYVPEKVKEPHRPANKRGRVVGGVRLVPMPEGRSIRDYFFPEWDPSPRWPIGWPCCVAYAPTIEQCPMLRSIVEPIHGPDSFRPYARRLRNGPVELDRKVADRLDEWFADLPIAPNR